ncbi:MAG: hypothetical protein ABDI07_12245, partial [Candidatus Kryptonium sp.]
TSIGIEGIEYGNSKNILIANTKDEFIKKILACLRTLKQEMIFEISNDLNKYNIKTLASSLFKFYKKISSEYAN